MSFSRESGNQPGVETTSSSAPHALPTESPAAESPNALSPVHIPNRNSYHSSYYGSTFEDHDENVSQTFLSPRSAPAPFDAILDRQPPPARKFLWPAFTILAVLVSLLPALVILFATQINGNGNDAKHTSSLAKSASHTPASIFTHTPQGPEVASTDTTGSAYYHTLSATTIGMTSTETLYTTFGTTTVTMQANVTRI